MSVQGKYADDQIREVICFNTSYVSVQGGRRGENDVCEVVSIHHMCRFKREIGEEYRAEFNSFNTSYVSVQDFHELTNTYHLVRFNTSYVSVQELSNAIYQSSKA